MKKKRNRIYRRIAIALTVALLAGQGQALVLAEEGDVQTEISAEKTDVDTSDNGSETGGNTENNSGTEQGGDNGDADNQPSKDNENNGDQQGDGDGQDKCVCGTKCAADAVNTDCPVCAADYASCAGKEEDVGNNDTGNSDTENNGLENTDGNVEDITDGQKVCICETMCTEESKNADCPVCAADYTACASKMQGEVKLPEETALEEVLTADEGIATLAEEDVEAYAVGDVFTSDGIQYKVTSEDNKEVSVSAMDGSIAGNVIAIPESVEGNGNTYRVTSIGDMAFYGRSNLTSVTIPESVTSIGELAFSGCSGLTSVTIPENVTSIGQSVFRNCSGLTSVTVPGSVEKVAFGAFWGCSSLTSVTMQPGVTSIGDNAFCECSSLSSVTIPKGVTSIDTGAFYKCSNLSSVEIPEGVTFMGLSTFAECSSLSSVTIPKSYVVSLDNPHLSVMHTVFKDCVNLTTVTLSEKISRIPPWMFQGCTKLTTLNILIEEGGAVGFPGYPGNDIVGKEAFDGCPSGRKVVFWNADGTKKLTGDDWKNARDTYLSNNDGDTSDNLWHGWLIDEPLIETPTTYQVTIHVNLDGDPWDAHGKTFALLPDSGGDFLKVPGEAANDTYKISGVSNGAYSVYDITGVSPDALSSGARAAGLPTGVTVTVQDGNAEATVNYYSATFYDYDAVGNEVAYGNDTDQRQQIVLSGQKVAQPISNPTEPKDPGKAGWRFDGWKTEDGADYDFEPGIDEKKKIYASWIEAGAPVTTYIINASATEGGSISPSGRVSVNKGDSKTFTITPNEGYRLKAVMVNGIDRTASLTDGKNYTFTNIVQNHNIQAVFERGDGENPNPNPNPNPDPGGDNLGGGGGGTGDNSGGGSDGGGSTGDHDGGSSGGGGNSDGGNSGGDSGNTNFDSGNGAGSGQTAAGTETSSVQAASGAVGTSAGGNAAGGAAGTAESGSVSATSGQTAGGTGTAANGKEPKTGDASYLEVYATLAMIAGLTYLLLYMMEESRGMSEREKEAFVAAFIRWGKKGGAFRKGCAVAAIFCLLAYYHTIGKRAGSSTRGEKYLGQAF